MSELLPCPFCGEPLGQREGMPDALTCLTKDCFGGNTVVFITDPDDIAAWNRRPAPGDGEVAADDDGLMALAIGWLRGTIGNAAPERLYAAAALLTRLRPTEAEVVAVQSGWQAHYDDPRHLAMDLRQIADNADARVGYATLDAQIIRRAAACFDGLSEDATAEDTRQLLALPSREVAPDTRAAQTQTEEPK